VKEKNTIRTEKKKKSFFIVIIQGFFVDLGAYRKTEEL
jgi:hypothetical protein